MAAFCKYLGMDAQQIKLYSTGALFHDIGKTQIPAEIIQKPDKYGTQEQAIIQKHPEHGKEILSSLKNIDPVMIEVVYEHHERMDGSGYPKGLKGHDISLGGRMVSILDVYDALTSDRPYNDAQSPTDVLKQLFAASPEKYDLELLQKFIHSIGIYPLGSLLRLSTGFLGIVIESPKEDLLHPTVLIIYDINKSRFIPSRRLDLSQGVGELHKIVSTESPSKWDIDISEFMKLN
jgi:putative nucleotidyltransferase with HDIG domain